MINLEILQRFGTLLKSGRMAHAYLLAGPQGMGKSETAIEVAKLVNCDRRESQLDDRRESQLDDRRESQLDDRRESRLDCQCSSCLRINSRNHPDVYFVDCGETDSIKIAQVRELITRLQMRAFEAATKICIIKDIEKMTADSSNALLKTLEEPSADTLMLLTTSVPEENLKTVVSRCHVIKFYSMSVAAVRQALIKEDSLAVSTAQCLAQFSQGCLGKARELKHADFLVRKNDVIDQLVMRENSDQYLKKILSDKPETHLVLTVLLSWFRDLLILKSGCGQEQLVHLDRYDELLTLEKKYTFAKIDGILEEVVAALALLGENLNIKIPFILLREKIWVK